MRFDIGRIREKLGQLDWGDGLTRDGIRRQWHRLPARIYDVLPREYVFRNAGEVMSYLEHLMRHGALQDLRDTGGEPQDYQPSLAAPGQSPAYQPREHGVGSGADPGYTGGGSVQSGIGRQGTTYGDTEEALPD